LIERIASENFQKTLMGEENFVQYEAIVAGKKFLPVTLTATQQEIDILVATSLHHLSVNLRPDF